MALCVPEFDLAIPNDAARDAWCLMSFALDSGRAKGGGSLEMVHLWTRTEYMRRGGYRDAHLVRPVVEAWNHVPARFGGGAPQDGEAGVIDRMVEVLVLDPRAVVRALSEVAA